MEINKNILVSIDDTDIKKGVLKLPKTVKHIDNNVINRVENLAKVIAPLN